MDTFSFSYNIHIYIYIHIHVCVCVCVCVCVYVYVCVCVCVCVCIYALHVYTYMNTRVQFSLLVHASAFAVCHLTSALTVSALLLFFIQAPPISERSSDLEHRAEVCSPYRADANSIPREWISRNTICISRSPLRSIRKPCRVLYSLYVRP